MLPQKFSLTSLPLQRAKIIKFLKWSIFFASIFPPDGVRRARATDAVRRQYPQFPSCLPHTLIPLSGPLAGDAAIVAQSL